ncbi:hypothetical protein IGI04_013968 [Brassica rapa subsp. trilocularis]|uniref:Uncharacterized protein n=1 Tax=Brassica rapa subsp. trilocularis TaxID=1813537 RepID=A0ABQ7NDL4_BRACM|nr:hypothetical protein IGI04_013968 [Brassica rapa subsp. trilocularis]
MTCTYLLTCLLIRGHMLVTSCLLQLLVSFFMEEKCSAACTAWCAETCHQLSNLSFVFCGSKPSCEATPYDIKYPLLSSGRPVTARKTREKFREKERKKREKSCVLVWLRAEDLVSKSLESPKFFSLGFYRLKFISTKFILKLEEIGQEDTMMGSHPGRRITVCNVRCSIFEYLMAMMAGDFTLGRERTSLASDLLTENLGSLSEQTNYRVLLVGLKSLELYPIGALVFFGFRSKAIGSILRTSDRPSRNIDRVISGHLLSGVSQRIDSHGYLTVIFHSRSTETSLNGWSVLTEVIIIMIKFATLMVGFTTVLIERDLWNIIDTSNTSPDSCVIDVKVGVVYDLLSVGGRDGLTVLQDDGSTRSILFATEYHEAYDAKKKKIFTSPLLRELQEGFGSKLFGNECYELLVESQELLQRVEFKLERFHEFKNHMTCTYLLTCLLIRGDMLVTSCLLQLLVSFFMEGKCSAACTAWCAETCHQLSNLSFVFCGSKPSCEATPYDIKYPLLSSGRPVTARKTREKFREKERKKREKSCVLVWLRAEDLVSKSLESPKFFSLGFYRLKFISTKFILKLEEIGHEDTMMGSHPGGRVTACSVRCSIFEYLMAMMSLSEQTNYRVLLVGLKSLELYPIGALVFFGFRSKAIGSILRTSDRPSRNIDRVISGHLRSGVSQQ